MSHRPTAPRSRRHRRHDRRPVAALESLEFRRLLSVSYDQPTLTLLSPDGASQDRFGGYAVTHGDLALVTAPNKTINGMPGAGEAYLFNLATGQVRTLANPDPQAADQFGASAAFVGGNKIAIGTPEAFGAGHAKVYVYDLTAPPSAAPLEIFAPVSEAGGATSYARSIVSDGSDLYVSMLSRANANGGGGILRYDASTGALKQTYFNTDHPQDTRIGTAMAVANGTIYASAKSFHNSQTVNSVLAIDQASGAIVNTFTQPAEGSPWSDFSLPLNQFGWSLAVAPNGHLFVGDADAVFQYDSAGDKLHRYVSPQFPDGGIESFGRFIATNDQGQLLVGAPETVALNDDWSAGGVAGAVYVFDYTTHADVATISNPEPTLTADFLAVEAFGTIVAPLPNGAILITNPIDSNENGVDAGIAYAYGYEAPVGNENNPPTDVTITASSAAVRQQAIAFAGSFTDLDQDDTHVITWDFGDGNSASGLNATHAYAASGEYLVTLTVSDGQASASTTHLVTITATGVQNGVLYVGGTAAADSISVSKSTNGATVTVDGVTTEFAGPIVIYAGDGDDLVTVGGSVSALVEIHGGAGNDTLKGGNGGSILIGGEGDDSLTGGAGRDLLVGGDGADSLTGSPDDDVLIAGTTTADLGAVYAAWAGSASYADRVEAVRALVADKVFDDGHVDTLIGASGQDYFIFNKYGDVVDVVVDLKKFESSDDETESVVD